MLKVGCGKNQVRHRDLTAHARARYRCFLPDLAGLARVRRVRPIPDLLHSSIRNWLFVRASKAMAECECLRRASFLLHEIKRSESADPKVASEYHCARKVGGVQGPEAD